MKLKIKFLASILGYLYILGLLQGCAYSFTGTNISPNVKSISIQNFYNDSGGGPPNLTQIFTENIRDFYQRNTDLALVENDGDLQLEGAIVGYNLAPVAPTATGNNEMGDLAGLQRLTIAVKVNYVNTADEKQNFDKTFSFYADYDPNRRDFREVENELINQIFESIVFDIFNATVANW